MSALNNNVTQVTTVNSQPQQGVQETAQDNRMVQILGNSLPPARMESEIGIPVINTNEVRGANDDFVPEESAPPVAPAHKQAASGDAQTGKTSETSGEAQTGKTSETSVQDEIIELKPVDLHKYPYHPVAKTVGDVTGTVINAKKVAVATQQTIAEAKANGKPLPPCPELSAETVASLCKYKLLNTAAWATVNTYLLLEMKKIISTATGKSETDPVVSSAAGFLSSAMTTILLAHSQLITTDAAKNNITCMKAAANLVEALRKEPIKTLKLCYTSSASLYSFLGGGIFGATFTAVNDYTYARLMHRMTEAEQKGNHQLSPLSQKVICCAASTFVGGVAAQASYCVFDALAKTAAADTNNKIAELAKKTETSGEVAKVEAKVEGEPKVEVKGEVSKPKFTKTLAEQASRFGKTFGRNTRIYVPFMVLTGVLCPIFAHLGDYLEEHPEVTASIKESVDNLDFDENGDPILKNSSHLAILGNVVEEADKKAVSSGIVDSVEKLELDDSGEWTLKGEDAVPDTKRRSLLGYISSAIGAFFSPSYTDSDSSSSSSSSSDSSSSSSDDTSSVTNEESPKESDTSVPTSTQASINDTITPSDKSDETEIAGSKEELMMMGFE